MLSGRPPSELVKAQNGVHPLECIEDRMRADHAFRKLLTLSPKNEISIGDINLLNKLQCVRNTELLISFKSAKTQL